MIYVDIKDFSNTKFKRLVGVSKEIFQVMLDILLVAHAKKHEYGGKPDEIPLADKLLMMLSYLREYRTYAHIGASFCRSESQVCRIVHWCEDVLIKSGKFTVTGKQRLLKLNKEHVILIDATESPIQRPKKKSKALLLR